MLHQTHHQCIPPPITSLYHLLLLCNQFKKKKQKTPKALICCCCPASAPCQVKNIIQVHTTEHVQAVIREATAECAGRK